MPVPPNYMPEYPPRRPIRIPEYPLPFYPPEFLRTRPIRLPVEPPGVIADIPSVDLINVGKSVNNPNFDVKLTDANGNKLGLILCNLKGGSDRRGLLQANMPRTAMQLATQSNSYDNMEMPYVVEVQTSMIGGRGNDDFARDKTRYADGFRIDTSSQLPICGPAIVPQFGYLDTPLLFDKPVTNWEDWQAYTPDPADPTYCTDYNSMAVTGTKTFSAMSVYLHGWTGPMTIYYAINGSIEGSKKYCLNMQKVVYGNGVAQWVHLPYAVPITVTDGPVTWGWGTNIKSYVLAASGESLATAYYSDATHNFTETWPGGNRCWMSSLIYQADVEYKFFQYKRALYCVKNDLNRKNTAIYRNGYRGLATSNSADLSFINTGISIANTSALGHCVALISNGPGELEYQNWREISYNNPNGACAVSSPWKEAHTTSTEYVILGTDHWDNVYTCANKVITSILPLQDYVLFASGDDANLMMFREYNDSGTWRVETSISADATHKYHYLALTQDGRGKLQIWAANADTCKVTFGPVLAYPTFPAFDIWPDERDAYNSTITRLDADILAAPVDDAALITRLGRQREDAIKECTKRLTYIQAGDTSSHINNMIIYGSPGIPYIMKETEIGSIYQNVYSKIPIAEVEAVRSERNGKAAMAHDVYLYLNLEGGWIERYYDQRMDDVSPNRDEGLPRERQGEISKLLAYAGRWYAAVNAGYSGISSVLVNNELGWHEIYRSSQVGRQITDIHVQAIPGISNPDLLWISEGNDILSIPIAISPTKQQNYRYYGRGLSKDMMPNIETPWIDFAFKDVNKYFHALNLFMDMPDNQLATGTEYETHVWYKTDKTDPNVWIYIGKGTAMPGTQEFPILLDGLHKVWGKQIKFKIAMKSNIEYFTPRLKGWVCNAVVRFEVKRSWMLTFQMQPDRDLNGKKIIMDPNEIYEAMAIWANSKYHATPLRMNTNDIITDGALVFIDPVAITSTEFSNSPNEHGAKREIVYIGSTTIFEV